MIFFISQIGKLLWREKKGSSIKHKVIFHWPGNYLNVTCFHLLFSSANVPGLTSLSIKIKSTLAKEEIRTGLSFVCQTPRRIHYWKQHDSSWTPQVLKPIQGAISSKSWTSSRIPSHTPFLSSEFYQRFPPFKRVEREFWNDFHFSEPCPSSIKSSDKGFNILFDF